MVQRGSFVSTPFWAFVSQYLGTARPSWARYPSKMEDVHCHPHPAKLTQTLNMAFNSLILSNLSGNSFPAPTDGTVHVSLMLLTTSNWKDGSDVVLRGFP